MIVRLAERGVLSLDDKLPKLLPAFAATMDPAYRDVTLAQLLSHTAGLAPLTDDAELPAFMNAIRGASDVRAERAAAARHYLALPPASKVGTDIRIQPADGLIELVAMNAGDGDAQHVLEEIRAALRERFTRPR